MDRCAMQLKYIVMAIRGALLANDDAPIHKLWKQSHSQQETGSVYCTIAV